MLIKAIDNMIFHMGNDFEDRLQYAMAAEMCKMIHCRGAEAHHITTSIELGEGELFTSKEDAIHKIMSLLGITALPSPTFTEHLIRWTATYYVGDHYLLMVGTPHNERTIMFRVVTDQYHHAGLVELLERLNAPEKPKPKLHAMLRSSHGAIEVSEVGEINAPFQAENYSDEVAYHFSSVMSALRSDSPQGRLIILEGPPGTGKTWFVKGLIHALPELHWTLVPVSMVESMSEPNFLPALIQVRNNIVSPVYWYKSGTHTSLGLSEKKKCPFHVLVIEDGDRCLLPRESDNISAISSLLNLSDGMIGSALNLAVLITTNVSIRRRNVGLCPNQDPDLNVDKALLRPGRMLRHIQIRSLGTDQANSILRREGSDDLYTGRESPTLAEVYGRIGREEPIQL